MSDLTFNIESNVPIPERGYGSEVSKVGRTLRAMNVGDSVLLIPEDGNKARQMLPYLKLKFAMKFCTRGVEGGVRIWRIE